MTVKPQTVPKIMVNIFAVWCVDGPNSAEIRKRFLDGHFSYVEANFDRYLVAGPMRRGGEPTLAGSLFIIKAENEDDARSFMAGDPYIAEGAYDNIEYRTLTPAAGEWLGGIIWEPADNVRPTTKDGQK